MSEDSSYLTIHALNESIPEVVKYHAESGQYSEVQKILDEINNLCDILAATLKAEFSIDESSAKFNAFPSVDSQVLCINRPLAYLFGTKPNLVLVPKSQDQRSTIIPPDVKKEFVTSDEFDQEEAENHLQVELKEEILDNEADVFDPPSKDDDEDNQVKEEKEQIIFTGGTSEDEVKDIIKKGPPMACPTCDKKFNCKKAFMSHFTQKRCKGNFQLK